MFNVTSSKKHCTTINIVDCIRVLQVQDSQSDQISNAEQHFWTKMFKYLVCGTVLDERIVIF